MSVCSWIVRRIWKWSVSDCSVDIEEVASYLHTLCGDLSRGILVSTYLEEASSIGSVRLYLRTAVVACDKVLVGMNKRIARAKLTGKNNNVVFRHFEFLLGAIIYREDG